MYKVGEIVRLKTGSNAPEFAFITGYIPDQDIVGTVTIHRPRGTGRDGGYLVMYRDRQLLTDEEEINNWRNLIREHASELRQDAELKQSERLAKEAERLENYASLPTAPTK